MTDFSQWTQIIPSGLAPEPRSLHSAVTMGPRYFNYDYLKKFYLSVINSVFL